MGGMEATSSRDLSSNSSFCFPGCFVAQEEKVPRDPDLPRPNISLSPSTVAALGSSITIRCWAEGLNNTFHLHKGGEVRASQSAEPDGGTALFRISNMSLDHAGRYRCSYRPLMVFKSSKTSRNVELLMLDANADRPTISLRPSERVDLAANITIRCLFNGRGLKTFYLEKVGSQMPLELETHETMAMFFIMNTCNVLVYRGLDLNHL
ncbi:leukocyte immunoglobulin-like receptor subfamily A member 2 [Eublepharis macularius]|uniref:Leukocyte immunoglobulin-like receptor subfamily A member 2 n=1 Tax=Eublepharis macularius TaxID=481883 RepID=A0AA97LBM3_EUBMA|nr:leukocyte immunoglobulin-like receptor subfamily A member 2 [Eublepharis macularius]